MTENQVRIANELSNLLDNYLPLPIDERLTIIAILLAGMVQNCTDEERQQDQMLQRFNQHTRFVLSFLNAGMSNE